jgi:hypothetical protein
METMEALGITKSDLDDLIAEKQINVKFSNRAKKKNKFFEKIQKDVLF